MIRAHAIRIRSGTIPHRGRCADAPSAPYEGPGNTQRCAMNFYGRISKLKRKVPNDDDRPVRNSARYREVEGISRLPNIRNVWHSIVKVLAAQSWTSVPIRIPSGRAPITHRSNLGSGLQLDFSKELGRPGKRGHAKKKLLMLIWNRTTAWGSSLPLYYSRREIRRANSHMWISESFENMRPTEYSGYYGRDQILVTSIIRTGDAAGKTGVDN